MDDFKLPYPVSGDPIKASDIGNISRVLEPLINPDRGNGLSLLGIGGLKFSRGPAQSVYNIPVYNAGGSEIPSFGIIRIGSPSSSVIEDFDPKIFIGDLPNTYGCQDLHLINGPEPIATEDYGMATNIFPALVAYNSDDGTPAVGEVWGPKNGAGLSRKNVGGFMVVGNADTDLEIVLMMRRPFTRFKGVADAAIAKDATGTVSIWYGTGVGTDSTVNMDSVLNEFGDIASGVVVECVWEGDAAGIKWRFTQAEC